MVKTIEHKGRVTVAKTVRSSICLAMMAHGEPYEMFAEQAKRLRGRIDCYSVTMDVEDHETAKHVRRAFKGIPGEIHMVPWLPDKYGIGHGDYGANRNRMLEFAREWDKDYVLWLDPDDPVEGTIPDVLDHDVYLFEINVEGTTWAMHHMFRKDVEVQWRKPVHEHLEFADENCDIQNLEGVWLSRNGSGSYRDDRIRLRSIPLLLAMVEEDPMDGHAWYYLAQSYRDIGMKAEAVAAFNHRAEMGGEDQAVYWCRFQVAELTGQPDDYLIAWNCRPTRVEALHRLAEFYNARGQYVVGRHFAQVGCGIKPSSDGMFVERWVELYGMPAAYAHAAFYLGYEHNNPELIQRAIDTWEWILDPGNVPEEILQPAHKVLFESNLQEAREPGSGFLTSDYDRAFLGKGVHLGEGSISAQEAHFLGTLVSGWDEDRPMKIAQTGFGVGRSAWAFLENNPLCLVTSFDSLESENGHHIDNTSAICKAAEIIEENFPRRHVLIEGDSKETVPKNQDEWDLVFVDGGHDYETAMADLHNFARPGRIVVMDDTVVGPQWAEGVVRAWNEATHPETGFIIHRLESRDGPHVWSLGTYKDNDGS
jgi:predicted O-methyltransferase YrrM